MQLRDLLTLDQVHAIRETIVSQCANYSMYEELRDLLFYDSYIKNRKQYDLTAAILSAFALGKCDIPGFVTNDLPFGLHGRMCQPELISDRAILHIYSNQAKLNNNAIMEKCRLYNVRLDESPIFAAMVFAVDKNCDYKLKKLVLVVFDSAGEEAPRFDLMQDA